MIAMVYRGSMGLVVCHKVHWYNGLLCVIIIIIIIIIFIEGAQLAKAVFSGALMCSMGEMICHV